MSNIQITLIPTSEDFQLLDVFIGGNGIADPQELAEVHLPAGIDWRKGVIINGRGPIWLYAFLVHQCHPAAWVAVMDPRHGAIIVEAHHPAAPAVGSAIPLERFQEYLPKHEAGQRSAKPSDADTRKRIVFVGPPNSGKSVLLRALYSRLQARLPMEQFQRDVFLIRACPDGEGNWFGEIPLDRAVTLRHKSVWDDAFVADMCKHLEGVVKNKQLILVDLGGRIDRYSQQILNRCSHAVIVSRDPAAIAEWRGALRASEIKVLAEIESVLEDVCQVLGGEPLRLRLGVLERGKEISRLPEELVETIASRR
jgi:CRISPR-associated protein Csx3